MERSFAYVEAGKPKRNEYARFRRYTVRSSTVRTAGSRAAVQLHATDPGGSKESEERNESGGDGATDVSGRVDVQERETHTKQERLLPLAIF